MRSTFRFASAVLVCAASLAVVGCTDDNDSGGGGPTSFTLTVTKQGGGTGTVTSNTTPAIDCGTTCSAVLPAGTSVTLTAAAGAGSTFGGWSLASCSTATCTFTLSEVTDEIQATFNSNTAPTPASVIGLTNTGKLISFEPDAPDAPSTSSVTISGLPSGAAAVGIDYRPANGLLYVLAKGSTVGSVCKVDPRFGTATGCLALLTDLANSASGVALDGTTFGIDFNPQADRLRVVSSTGQNLRINVDTGLTVIDTALNGTVSGASAAAYTNNYPSSGGTALFVINDDDDSLYLQNPPNGGTTTLVGALGVSTSGASGFDVVGTGTGVDAANEALFAAVTGGLSRLYSVNLGSGAATLIASIETGVTDGSVRVTDLAIKPVGTQLPAGNTYALVGGNQLISFNRAAPGAIQTRTFIAGLRDQLIGMDFRFKDSKLYAVGIGGNLYTIDTASGIATRIAGIDADGDSTAPTFSGFNGAANFGVDFDPVADSGTGASLSVLDSTGQNIKVIVEGADAGNATRLQNATDDPASGSTRPNHGGIRAIGYTNGFYNALSQTLYAVDTDRDILYTIRQSGSGNNPESEPVPVGALGVDVASKDGLDIDGLTGDAWFVATVGGQAKLHQINLTSGVLGGTGALIGDGTLDIRGLALPAPKQPVVYGLVSDGTIVTFAPNAPDTLLSGPLPVTGLSGADVLVAMHFRPSDNTLFALARSGNLYTINPTPTTSYVATLVSGGALRPDPNDNASPYFTALATTGGVALDFDPLTSDQSGVASLRIVASAGAQYLRSNSSNGATFADSALALPDPSLVPCDLADGLNAAGSAFNKAGTLYVINADTSASCLYTAPPAGGVMSNVGPMLQGLPGSPAPAAGDAIAGVGGFDIVGSHDGLRLAALDLGGSQSVLHRISLGANDTGVHAAAVANIGPASLPKLLDMTILLAP